jgi:hypothetical protein
MKTRLAELTRGRLPHSCSAAGSERGGSQCGQHTIHPRGALTAAVGATEAGEYPSSHSWLAGSSPATSFFSKLMRDLVSVIALEECANGRPLSFGPSPRGNYEQAIERNRRQGRRRPVRGQLPAPVPSGQIGLKREE